MKTEFVPIQNDIQHGRVDRRAALMGYAEYVHKYGHSQSFQRLHERGGFGTAELITLLTERCERLEKALND